MRNRFREAAPGVFFIHLPTWRVREVQPRRQRFLLRLWHHHDRNEDVVICFANSISRGMAMCFRELIDELRRQGIHATESQIRWAIQSGKVARPPLTKSLNFNFDDGHLERLVELFAARQATCAPNAINE